MGRKDIQNRGQRAMFGKMTDMALCALFGAVIPTLREKRAAPFNEDKGCRPF